MGHKFGYYVVPMPLEEVYERTRLFWVNHKGIIKQTTTSPNGLIKTITVSRGASLTGWGESYAMNLGYNPKEGVTYVNVEVALNFGYGPAWGRPQSMMRLWAQALGTTPMKLVRKIDNDFYKVLDEIEKLPPPSGIQAQQEVVGICPSCGHRNKPHHKFCINCGSKVFD